ncbi:hypothetical protein A2U01_0103341, partial [Trifolium medium]|nr:hypothetical protein [Trifolium medium]
PPALSSLHYNGTVDNDEAIAISISMVA